VGGVNCRAGHRLSRRLLGAKRTSQLDRAAVPDQEARDIQSKMAAEWIRLADAIVDLSKPIK